MLENIDIVQILFMVKNFRNPSTSLFLLCNLRDLHTPQDLFSLQYPRSLQSFAEKPHSTPPLPSLF